MNFGEALQELKSGSKVARDGWNGKGMWLQLVKQIEGEGVVLVSNGEGRWYETLPWVGMKTADAKFVPWLASQTDILAEDWGVV